MMINNFAHEVLFASENSMSITENINSSLYSPGEENNNYKVDYKKNIMFYTGYQNCTLSLRITFS